MEINITGVDALERIGREFPKATSRALNRTMSTVKTQMVRDGSKRYKIKAGELRKASGKISKANVRRLLASFKASGKRFPLVKFVTDAVVSRSMEQLGKKLRSRPKQITATITRGAKAKYRGAFAAIVAAGGEGLSHTGIFVRTGKKMKSNPKRDAIKQLSAASLPQMFGGTWERLIKSPDVRAILEKNLKHEIEWELFGKSATPPTDTEGE